MDGAGSILWMVVLIALASLPLALSVWALLDCANRPAWAWAMADRRQVVWMAAILFGFLSVIGGIAISGWYLLKVRPQVAAVEHGDLGRLS